VSTTERPRLSLPVWRRVRRLQSVLDYTRCRIREIWLTSWSVVVQDLWSFQKEATVVSTSSRPPSGMDIISNCSHVVSTRMQSYTTVSRPASASARRRAAFLAVDVAGSCQRPDPRGRR
jgi:hypothetical protein